MPLVGGSNARFCCHVKKLNTSCSGAKESWEVERKQGSPEKWMTWVKNQSLKLNFSKIYYKLKF